MKIKRGLISFLVTLLFCCNVFAQESIKHTVMKGDTITQIAQRYRVTPFDIYSLIPTAEAGIKENDVLNIPSHGKDASAPKPATSQQTVPRPATHTAKAKETLFSIARQYNVTVEDLRNANPILSGGLKIGQVIKIPGGTTSVAAEPKTPARTEVNPEPKSGKSFTHVVEP